MKKTLKKLFGYIPSPIRCSSSEEIAKTFGGVFSSTQKDSIYCQFHFILNEKTRDLFIKKFSKTQYAPDFCATIPMALLYGHGAVISPDGINLARDVTPDFGADSSSHWIIKNGDMLKPPKYIKGKTLVAIHNVSRTYYHWLFEELPRLLSQDLNNYEFVLTSGLSVAQNEVLNHFKNNFRNKTRFYSPKGYETFRCEKLVVPSLPDRCKGEDFFDENRPSFKTCQQLREFAFSIINKSKNNFYEKIYITRKNAKSRQLLNENEILEILKEQGFVIIELENSGFCEQVQLFRNAKCIVAPHGSGLANLVFCDPGTTVVEIFHKSYIKPMYAFISMHQNLDYRPLISDDPIANVPGFDSSFSIDPRYILAELKTAIF